MSSFDQDQVIENRLSAYQQSLLSVMGVTQWYLRDVEGDDVTEEQEVNASPDADEKPSVADNARPENRAASIHALRDVLSSGESKTDDSLIAASPAITAVSEPGLAVTFSVAAEEKRFVEDIVSAVADEIKVPVKWHVGEQLSVSEQTLYTPAISTLMKTSALKKQLWDMLQTFL